ncbi:MAG: alanine--tRNA ligase [Bacillota bacterium]
MQPKTTSQIRQAFLDFFASKGHQILDSYPLLPKDDPTLLWINAGVAPLKPYFSGHMIPENPRMANSQKCIRTVDIENVGKTARHHTFFEMLGNFSIGDYFKRESLAWGLEFLTRVVGLPQDRLWVTVHPDDDEAKRIWIDEIGFPADRVMMDEDNFWDIGPGPCGPNSEIYFDQGESFACDSPDCGVGCDCDRYLEVWNHVFSQYMHNQDGSYTPLPRKNIDTGMSLERLAAVAQGVGSNYAIDLFQPIMAELEQRTGLRYGEDEPHTMAFRVIADHLRGVTFAIADGAMPQNEGRGYVIRRLLRRAVRFGKTLGFDQPFLYQLVPLVVAQMGDAYPELGEKQEFVQRVMQVEEERFHETLDEGMGLLQQLLNQLKETAQQTLAGQDAFRLYDTYGFPLDLTEDIAAEQGIAVDRSGFEQAMAEQRQRARAARGEQESDFGKENIFRETAGGDQFVGYDLLSCPAQVIAIAKDQQLQSSAQAGETVEVLFDQTVFYAESGGQIADIGSACGDGVELEVLNVQKASGDKILHRCQVQSGSLQLGQLLRLQVAASRRQAIRRAHSATHLLHKALQTVLGEHAHQAGSLVEPDRLRFDFSHFSALTAAELSLVEQEINRQVLSALPVDAQEMSLEQAKAHGATALFGEKYGDVVRVVTMGDYSMELCGGTHVQNSAEIGQVRLLGEGGIGSGLRRIEAITGEAAYRYACLQTTKLQELADLLKVTVEEAPRRLEQTLTALRDARREADRLASKLAAKEADDFLQNAPVVDGVTVVARQVEAKDMDSLRGIADTVKDKLPSGVIVLGAAMGDKVSLVAAVSPDLLQRQLHAGKLIKEVAKLTGGGGGGRPEMAQAGGKDVSKLPQALASVSDLVARQLGL